MKLFKKMLSALLIFTLCFSLISSISVFADVKHDGYIIFDLIDDDVVTINMNLKKNLANSYGFQINSPVDTANPGNMQNVYSRGFARLTADGGMKVKDDGNWMNDDKSGGNALDVVFPADGNWYNFKLRVNNVTKKVEWYFEDNLVFTSSFTKKDGEYAANSLIMFGDGDYEAGGLEWELVSAIGTKENEVAVEISDHDTENKTITLNFSEPLASANALSGLTLKNTNTYGGEADIPLSVKSMESSTVTLSYKGNLSNRTEYAIVLPKDLAGKFGNTISKNILYINTEYSSSAVVEHESNYENYNPNKDITVLQSVSANIKYFDDVNKNTFVIDNYKSGASNKWLNWSVPSGIETFLSFDIIPLYNDLRYAIEFSNYDINSTPIYIAFALTGDIVCGNDWPNAAWFDVTGMNGNWSKAGTSGKYTANQKINFRIVYNDSTNLTTVYMNETEIKKFAGNIQDVNKIFGGIRFRGMSDSRASGEEVMLLDNVRSGYIVNAAGITSVKYYNTDGEEFGSFDTVEGIFDCAKVYFSAAVNEASIDDGDAYVSYNDSLVDCTTSYYTEDNCLVINPDILPMPNDEISVSISGIEDLKGNGIDAVVSRAAAGSFVSGFYIEKIGLTDSGGSAVTDTIGGEVFADIKATNTGEEDKNVIVTTVGYKNGALERHSCKEALVKAHSIVDFDKINNAVGIDSSNMDAVAVMIQEAETGKPLCDGVTIKSDSAVSGELVFADANKEKLSKDENVIVEIYAPDKSFADLKTATDFRDVLLYKEIVKADSEGAYKVNYAISYANAVSGMYTINAYGDEYSHTQQILYTNPTSFSTVLENKLMPALKSGNSEALSEILLSNCYDLYVDDKYINEEIADRAAELLIDYNAESAITASNARRVISRAVAIAAFEKGKLSDILAEDEIFGLDDSTIKDYYKEPYVMDNTKRDIEKRLGGKKYSSIKSFYEALEDVFILSVVANPNMPNSAATVMKAFGISGTDKQYANVTGNSYATIEALSKAISESPKGSSSGGSSGGSTGGGSGSSKQVGAASVSSTSNGNNNQSADNVSKPVYDDLYGYDWATEAIEYLTELKVVNGKGEGKFYPEDYITREEFTKMIVNALDIPLADEEVEFTDVAVNAWYAPYIKAAYYGGVVNGHGDNIFGIGRNITREDMAVMVYRAASKQGLNLSAEQDNILFADDAAISDYARESVYALKYNKIISGVGNNEFSGKAFATRAEASKMIYEVIKK